VASFNRIFGEIEREEAVFRIKHEPAFDKWRRDDLYHLAQQQGIEDRANMTNEELARALSHGQSGSS